MARTSAKSLEETHENTDSIPRTSFVKPQIQLDSVQGNNGPKTQKARDTVNFTTLPAIERTVQMTDLERTEVVKENPQNSGVYYVFRCPDCNQRNLYSRKRRSTHNRVHNWNGPKRSIPRANMMQRYRVRIEGATKSWAKERNSILPHRAARGAPNTPLVGVLNGGYPRNVGSDNKHACQESRGLLNNRRRQALPQKHITEVDVPLAPPFVVGCDGLYVAPQCMEGVPIKPIGEKSTYWEHTWQSREDYVQKRNALRDDLHHRRIRERTARQDKLKHLDKLWGPNNLNQLLKKAYINGPREPTGLYAGQLVDSLVSILGQLDEAEKIGIIRIPASEWFHRRLVWRLEERNRDDKPFLIKKFIREFQDTDEGFLRVLQGLRGQHPLQTDEPNTVEQSGKYLNRHITQIFS